MADTPDLPPLPESSWHPQPHERAFSPDQMQAYAREAVRLAARASVPADVSRLRDALWRIAEAFDSEVMSAIAREALTAAPTPPDEATSRAQFEAWASSQSFNVDRSYDDIEKGEYHRATTRWAWMAWQAARTQGDRA